MKKFNLHEKIEQKSTESKNVIYYLVSQENHKIANEVRAFIQTSQKIKNMKIQRSFIEIGSNVELKDPKQSFVSNLVQTSISDNPKFKKDSYFILAEERSNRLLQFIWAMLILVVVLLACFLFVKNSIEWANHSQTELNKIKTNQMEGVAKDVKNKFSYILNTDV